MIIALTPPARPRPAKWLASALTAAVAAVATVAPLTASAQTTLKVVMHSDLKIVDPILTTAYITRNHGYMIYDTLFATDEKGEIKLRTLRAVTARLLSQGNDLVLEHMLRIVQQPADERGLAVIDGPAGDEAQDVLALHLDFLRKCVRTVRFTENLRLRMETLRLRMDRHQK